MSSSNSNAKSDDKTPSALLEQLKSDDTAQRLSAVRKISVVAQALGAQRTREELLIYLTECVDDEDKVLQALAEELGEFLEFVGGVAFIATIIPPLELMAAAEESSVRSAAVVSLNKLLDAVSDAKTYNNVSIELLRHLTKRDLVTSRASAAQLLPLLYTKADLKTKTEMNAIFLLLCKDETPLVKRASASAFPSFISQTDVNVAKDFGSVFAALCSDDQDSVRLLMTDGVAAMAKFIPAFSTFKGLCSDPSWRVRYMIADHFPSLCSALSPPAFPKDMAIIFASLLKDKESEVRAAAALRLSEIISFYKKEIVIAHIIPTVTEMVKDPAQPVRAALARSVGALAPILGKDDTMKHIIPVTQQLLKDEAADTRLNMIAYLEPLNKTVGTDPIISQLLPAITQLAEDKVWRVRLSIIEKLPVIAANFGVTFFNERLASLCIAWLSDAIYAIRQAAGKNIAEMTKLFGVEWAKTVIIPKVLALQSNQCYLHRLTTLFTINELVPVVGADINANFFLPLVLRMAQDKVPNVRFNVALTFKILVAFLDEATISTRVKPCLQKLCDDNDIDVKFFSQGISSKIK